ncbi:hypothetical protein MNBD_GAMMA05-1272 [hydrothermal vent metagenome]|uniref:Methyltransferase domain-containing protein n=1 Tax=hydrothermal vent metagenome TaxID=652676 RepID=A0A3B0WN61_9ZZZZ
MSSTENNNEEQRFKTDDADSYNAVVDYFDQYTERFTCHLPEPLLAMANAPDNGEVLDVGTGTGIVALDVASRLGANGKVVGIDLSDGMLSTAMKKAEQKGLQERTEFLKMDAERLTFENNKFDAALSLYALRHFPNPDESVNEIFRVLKPGASLVAAVGSAPTLLSSDGVKAAIRRIGSIIRKSTGRELSACEFIDALVAEYIPERKDRDVTEWVEHHHGFTGSIKSLFVNAGFTNIRTAWKGQYSIIESAEDFWLLQMTYSSIARKRIQQADENDVEKLKAAFYQRCNQVLKKKGRLVYQSGAAIVSGTKPN